MTGGLQQNEDAALLHLAAHKWKPVLSICLRCFYLKTVTCMTSYEPNSRVLTKTKTEGFSDAFAAADAHPVLACC